MLAYKWCSFHCVGVHVLSMLFAFIYVDWCSTRFLYQRMLVSFTVTRLLSHVEQLNSSPNVSWARVLDIKCYVLWFVDNCFSLFFEPLSCQFFNILLLIILLVYSNFSYTINDTYNIPYVWLITVFLASVPRVPLSE